MFSSFRAPHYAFCTFRYGLLFELWSFLFSFFVPLSGVFHLFIYLFIFSSFINHLLMQSQRSNQKRATNKIWFFELQNFHFSFFFILTPPTSSMHNFLIFLGFKLSDLNCFEITILSSTNHLLPLKAIK